MFFVGLGRATPPWKYRQSDCWKAIRASSFFPGLKPLSQALLRKVLLGSNGIDSRHLALPELADAFDRDPDVLHRRFLNHGPRLASEAGRKALEDAGIAAQEVDALIISTCTGYLCPGLTSYVLESLGLEPDTLCLDLVGQGCGAALPNLTMGASLLEGGRAAKVLCICVEVCSAAFYIDDDPGVLISACLFGDGAGAAVLSRDPKEGRRKVECIHAESRTVPELRDALRFEQQGGMLRNILHPEVPDLAAANAKAVFDRATKRTGVGQESIRQWLWHAGGRGVLNALRDVFGLEEEQTAISALILRELGNISSPFVLHVLAEALARHQPAGHWWMASFGAGFSSHGALLKVSD